MNSERKTLLSGLLIMASSLANSLAHAQSVTLSPVSPHPQATVAVTGAHFADSEAIDVYVDTVDMLLLVSTATGTFGGTVTVPAAAAPGTHYITAIGRRSGDAAQAALTVTTPWVEFGYGAEHRGWNPYENTVSVDNVAQLDVLWSAPMTSLGDTPAVSSGKAFFGTSAGITALSTATGAVVWTAETNDSFGASPAVVAGVVYAVGESGNVYALAASNGAQKWSVPLGSVASSSPVVVAGVVYVADVAGTVYALQASTGNIKWSTPLAGPTYSSPAVANGTVYFVCNEVVYALNALTGALIWSYNTGGAVSGSPAVSGGLVYVGSANGSVYAIRTVGYEAGIPLWGYATGTSFSGSPAAAYGNVYIAAGNVLYAVDASGMLSWFWSSIQDSQLQTPAIANGVVYVSGDSQTLYALNANDGGMLGLWDTGTEFDGSPAISDGVVYTTGYGLGATATALSLLAGSGAVRSEPRAPDISTLHPDLTLEVTKNIAGRMHE